MMRDWMTGAPIHKSSGWQEIKTDCVNSICWRSNRSVGVWLEYPIVQTKEYDSVTTNWDEMMG